MTREQALRLVGRMTLENPPQMGFADTDPFYGVLVEGLIEHGGFFEIACRTSMGYWLVDSEERFEAWQEKERRMDEAFKRASSLLAEMVGGGA